MAKIILFRPSDDLAHLINEAMAEFASKFGVNHDILTVKNINSVASVLESGDVSLMFAEDKMDIADGNTLFAALPKSRRKPYFISSRENYELLTSRIAPSLVRLVKTEFDRAIVESSIWGLLTPVVQKLEGKHVKTIVQSVAEVLKASAGHDFVMQKIEEVSRVTETCDLAVGLAYNGRCFSGNMMIGGEKDLFIGIAEKMLFCDRSEIDDLTLVDLMGELSNQIMGKIRTVLSGRIKISGNMQIGVLSENMQVSLGQQHHYYIPFSGGGQVFHFWFSFKTFSGSIEELEYEPKHQPKNLDVRLVETVLELATQALEVKTGGKVFREKFSKLIDQPYKTAHMGIGYFAGYHGSAIVGLEIPKKTMEYFVNREASSGEEGSVFLSKVMKMICDQFLKLLEPLGYRMNSVIYTQFSGGDSLYLLRNLGNYIRFQCSIEGHSFGILFGIDSNFSSSLFDIWPYYNVFPQFTEQFELT